MIEDDHHGCAATHVWAGETSGAFSVYKHKMQLSDSVSWFLALSSVTTLR